MPKNQPKQEIMCLCDHFILSICEMDVGPLGRTLFLKSVREPRAWVNDPVHLGRPKPRAGQRMRCRHICLRHHPKALVQLWLMMWAPIQETSSHENKIDLSEHRIAAQVINLCRNVRFWLCIIWIDVWKNAKLHWFDIVALMRLWTLMRIEKDFETRMTEKSHLMGIYLQVSIKKPRNILFTHCHSNHNIYKLTASRLEYF